MSAINDLTQAVSNLAMVVDAAVVVLTKPPGPSEADVAAAAADITQITQRLSMATPIIPPPTP